MFIFCQASPVDYCHVLCCYVGVPWHCYLLHFKCYLAVYRRLLSFLFCSPFANRASDSGDLYIDFDRNHLIFPVACLVCQVHALFILSLPEHAYALHIMSCISCHVLHHVACALHRDGLLFHLLVFLPWVEPGVEYVTNEPFEYANKDQAFVNSENFVGKMTIPSKSLLSLLASCSLYCYAVIPTTCYIMPPILPCQASNPPFLANRCLAMLPLLLSPSYSVASCR